MPIADDGVIVWWHQAALVVALAFGYAAAMKVTGWFSAPGESVFLEPVIFWAVLVERLTTVSGVIVFVAASTILIISKAYRLQWTDLQAGGELRLFCLVSVVLLAWKFSSYGFNLYYGQWHIVDRLLIIAAIPIIWHRPVALAPFLFLIIAIQRQFHHPVPGYSWAVESLPIQIVTLFVVAIVVRSVVRRPLRIAFMVVLLSLFASNYWASGSAKLQMGWFTFDRVHLLLASGYANGWLRWLDAPSVGSLADSISSLDWLVRWLTFAVECGAVLFLANRYAAVVLVIGWVFFHTGILLASGIFFWTWIAADAALLVLLIRGAKSSLKGVFGLPQLALSMILIVSSGLWLNPATLKWFDSPVSYKYSFEATGISGTNYELPVDFFAPNDYSFRLSKFGYVTTPSQPVLPIAFGAVSERDLAERLYSIGSPAEVPALESEFGELPQGRERARRLFDYLVSIAERSNKGRGTPDWLRRIGAPPSVFVVPGGMSFRGQEPIVRIRVKQVASLYLEGEIRRIRDLEVAQIEIRQWP